MGRTAHENACAESHPSGAYVAAKSLGAAPAPAEMPDDTTRPASPAPAGLFTFTRHEDEDALRPLPREHDANGHYRIGPRLAKPPLVRMIGERILGGVEIAARAKAPAAERRRKARAVKKRVQAKRQGHAALAAQIRRPRWAA